MVTNDHVGKHPTELAMRLENALLYTQWPLVLLPRYIISWINRMLFFARERACSFVYQMHAAAAESRVFACTSIPAC